MKQVKFRMPLRMLALLCVIFLSATAFAQNITVKGNVKDATGEPIIGATVRAAGQDGENQEKNRNQHNEAAICLFHGSILLKEILKSIRRDYYKSGFAEK